MSKEQIEKLNQKYPLNLLRYKDLRVDLVDDNDADLMFTRSILEQHGIHNQNIRELTDPGEYKRAIDADPKTIGHICLFDYGFNHINLDGLVLTAMVIEKAKVLEVHFPDVIMVSGFKDFDVLYKFGKLGGFDYVLKGEDLNQFRIEFAASLTKAVARYINRLEQRGLIDEADELGKEIFKDENHAA